MIVLCVRCELEKDSSETTPEATRSIYCIIDVLQSTVFFSFTSVSFISWHHRKPRLSLECQVRVQHNRVTAVGFLLYLNMFSINNVYTLLCQINKVIIVLIFHKHCHNEKQKIKMYLQTTWRGFANNIRSKHS
jgi:hypothetical protein